MSARVILCRHAQPESGVDDDLRQLTEHGRAVQRGMARRLESMGIVPTRILHSPLIRAEQTAMILQEILGGELVEVSALAHALDEEAVLALLKDNETVILVGHNPTLPAFANHLVGQPYLQGGMEKSSALIVDFEGRPAIGEGQLSSYLKP